MVAHLTDPEKERIDKIGSIGSLSRHLANLAESVKNTQLYNNQYNEDLKELMMITLNSFKSSLYWLLYNWLFFTLSARLATDHDDGAAGPRVVPGGRPRRRRGGRGQEAGGTGGDMGRVGRRKT